jgi:cell filamentation protein, protein adenylyltransferase
VTFDPFGDFAARGYLRNTARTKDRAIVRQLEHSAFTTGPDGAFDALSKRKSLTYDDVLATHRILFEPVYPWAGQDRTMTAPDLAIIKGDADNRVRFADPEDIQRAVEYGLKLGHDKAVMAAKPGEVMGYLAFGHPFLDGNGRTIMVVHCILAHRAGIRIDWASTDKNAYLAALTRELKEPGQGLLDAYLKPFVQASGADGDLPANVAAAPGLDGLGEEVVLGKTNDAALKAEYDAEKRKRTEALG